MIKIEQLDVEEIVHRISSNEKEDRIALIHACPPCSMKESAILAAGMELSEMKPQALDFLASDYSNKGPYKAAAILGEATYRLARSMHATNDGDIETRRMIAGRGALNWMTGLKHLGHQEKVLQMIEDPISWLTEIGDTDNLDMLLLKRTETEFDLERYDDVERHLAEIDEDNLPPMLQISYRAQRSQLLRRHGGGVELRDEYPEYSSNDIARLITGEPTSAGGKMITAEEGAALIPVAKEFMNRFFGGNQGELNELTVRQKIIEAGYLFTDPVKGSDPDEIDKIVPVLIFGRDWMHENNFIDSENDACWSLYLCYSRTHRDALAVRELQRLRSNIEQARAGIADPLERSRLSARFPYLYQSLAGKLYATGDVEGLLEAIEASKGRVLADLQTQRRGIPADEVAFSQSIRALPALLKQAGASYLTYLVDDDVTFSVLIGPGGELSMHKINIGIVDLNQLSIAVDPRQWGKRDPVTLQTSPRVNDKLSPMVDFLSGLKNINHLCYSPSGPLLSLPLHSALLDGKPLATYFSISKIHGAASLYHLLANEPTTPGEFLSVEVPALQDLDNAEKLAALEEGGQWLEQNLNNGSHLQREDGDAVSLKQRKTSDRVVHFSTHGTFPDKLDARRNPNPIESSGLVLARDGQLPDLNRIFDSDNNILTPRKIVEMEFDFSHSHITLEACVTGLAKPSAGGDALGLEFSLLQLGAQSILSTQWNVNIQSMSRFIKSFYFRWLINGTSRSEAWRESVLELIEQYGASDEGAYHWAAFSLTGDWR